MMLDSSEVAVREASGVCRSPYGIAVVTNLCAENARYSPELMELMVGKQLYIHASMFSSIENEQCAATSPLLSGVTR